ncbi:hypothetical protein QVD99_002351 [Batrachochytrium dendrobatidis]|nr:hypothetical protein QVD99_002351 [Batrachochytrium dendrobatidis]
MKLAVAVLSSILFVCSATTASPVNPSAAKNTGASTSTFIPSENGIGLGALDDPIPGNVKYLLDKYVEIQDGRNQQSKIYWPLKSRHDDQCDVVMGYEKDFEILKFEAQKGNGNPKHGEFQKAKLDYEYQLSKLDKIRKSFDECQFKIGRIVEKKSETDQQIVSLILGTPLDLISVKYQALLIRGTHSVKDYLEQQSSKYESLGQNPIDQEYQNPSDQQCQDSQSSLDTLSGSGSFEQKVPSNKRQGFSKFMSRLGSFFGRPKREDREPLI